MVLRADDLVASNRLPRRSQRWLQYYRKVGTRRAQAISKVCFAAAARLEGSRIAEVRIAVGSVAPTVIRCVQTEEVLTSDRWFIEAARAAFISEIAPIDDIRSTANYRLRLAANLLEDFLRTVGSA